MIGAIGTFLGQVGGILALDLGTIRRVQAAPDGLQVAAAIVVLACTSDAIGNSPLLFINRMGPARLAISLAVATVLAVARLAVWAVSFALVVSLIERHLVALPRVMLIVGIGYAPMLLSALIVIPTLGPFLAKVLHTWALMAVATSIVVAGELPPREALGTALLAWLIILGLSRSSDRLVVGLLGRLSRRLLGVDVMARTRAINLLGRAPGGAAGPGSGAA